jgi:hypothetical protein
MRPEIIEMEHDCIVVGKVTKWEKRNPRTKGGKKGEIITIQGRISCLEYKWEQNGCPAYEKNKALGF